MPHIPMRDTSGDVMAQRYDANDVAVDDAFVVNTTTNHTQRNAKVIELNDGFYVVWGSSQGAAASTLGSIYLALMVRKLAMR